MGESEALGEGGGYFHQHLVCSLPPPFLRCWSLGHPISLLQSEGQIKHPIKNMM